MLERPGGRNGERAVTPGKVRAHGRTSLAGGHLPTASASSRALLLPLGFRSMRLNVEDTGVAAPTPTLCVPFAQAWMGVLQH